MYYQLFDSLVSVFSDILFQIINFDPVFVVFIVQVLQENLQKVKMTVLGVCGFSYTGSGAVIDYLSEFDGTEFCCKNEFLLPYYPEGLEDLRFHTCVHYTKYASGYLALDRFKRFTEIFLIQYADIN